MNKTNKVIIFGGNHHNTLGLVREFGENGIRPSGIIVDAKKNRNFTSVSKYWDEVLVVRTPQEGIECLKRKFVCAELPAVVIASADDTAAVIDANYDELKKYFLLPGFNEGGCVLDLMNKEKQVEYAKNLGIEMICSELLPLNSSYKLSNQYPVILKPVTSIEGEKKDIRIADSEKEEKQYIEELKNKGYERILRQPYLKKRIEYVLTGAVMPTLHKCNFTLVKHSRLWPNFFGTGSFSSFVYDRKIVDEADKVMTKVQQSGYSGMIDIEFFESNTGKIYVNEFNWRSSGRNFVGRYTGVYSAFWWYCAIIGQEFNDAQRISDKNGYTMNEISDIHHVLNREISLLEWFNDVRKTKSFAVWDRRDIKPFVVRVFSLVPRVFSKNTILI